jgi:hypothetical protein
MGRSRDRQSTASSTERSLFRKKGELPPGIGAINICEATFKKAIELEHIAGDPGEIRKAKARFQECLRKAGYRARFVWDAYTIFLRGPVPRTKRGYALRTAWRTFTTWLRRQFYRRTPRARPRGKVLQGLERVLKRGRSARTNIVLGPESRLTGVSAYLIVGDLWVNCSTVEGADTSIIETLESAVIELGRRRRAAEVRVSIDSVLDDRMARFLQGRGYSIRKGPGGVVVQYHITYVLPAPDAKSRS